MSDDVLPQFSMTQTVVVRIDCEPEDNIVGRFLRFCIDEEIWSLRMGSIGPKGAVQVFVAADSEALRVWLIGNGIAERVE